MKRSVFLIQYFKKNPSQYRWLQEYEKKALKDGNMTFVNEQFLLYPEIYEEYLNVLTTEQQEKQNEKDIRKWITGKFL